MLCLEKRGPTYICPSMSTPEKLRFVPYVWYQVFQGKLPSGTEIAVKRCAVSSTQGLEEFTAEIETIENLQHRNVIRLLGCCIKKEKDFLWFHIQREEMILVYEYMPNKSLASFLYSCIHWDFSFHYSVELSKQIFVIFYESFILLIICRYKDRRITQLV